MRNRKGYTLMELIIVVALLSAIAILLYSILGSGFRLYAAQSESAADLTNLRQVVSEITNKARITDSGSISYSSGILRIGSDSYIFINNTIDKNGIAMANDIGSFDVSIDNNILKIKITNLAGKSISTSISY